MRLSEQQKAEIQEKYLKGDVSHRALALEYGVSQTTINRILNPKYAARVREDNRERINKNRKNYQIKKYAPLQLHLKKDADIIKKLDSVENRQGYIKDLIRKDIDE